MYQPVELNTYQTDVENCVRAQFEELRSDRIQDTRKTLPAGQFMSEFQTLEFGLPRRVGKTRFIHEFYRPSVDRLLFPNHHMVRDFKHQAILNRRDVLGRARLNGNLTHSEFDDNIAKVKSSLDKTVLNINSIFYIAFEGSDEFDYSVYEYEGVFPGPVIYFNECGLEDMHELDLYRLVRFHEKCYEQGIHSLNLILRTPVVCPS